MKRNWKNEKNCVKILPSVVVILFIAILFLGRYLQYAEQRGSNVEISRRTLKRLLFHLI